jgi:hypothetical protein
MLPVIKEKFTVRSGSMKMFENIVTNTMTQFFIHSFILIKIVHDEMLISKTAVCRTSSTRKENCITQKMEYQISRQ